MTWRERGEAIAFGSGVIFVAAAFLLVGYALGALGGGPH